MHSDKHTLLQNYSVQTAQDEIECGVTDWANNNY